MALRAKRIARRGVRRSGFEFKQNSLEENLIVANNDRYIFFLVFHEPGGRFAGVLPGHVEADISVAPLPPKEPGP